MLRPVIFVSIFVLMSLLGVWLGPSLFLAAFGKDVFDPQSGAGEYAGTVTAFLSAVIGGSAAYLASEVSRGADRQKRRRIAALAVKQLLRPALASLDDVFCCAIEIFGADKIRKYLSTEERSTVSAQNALAGSAAEAISSFCLFCRLLSAKPTIEMDSALLEILGDLEGDEVLQLSQSISHWNGLVLFTGMIEEHLNASKVDDRIRLNAGSLLKTVERALDNILRINDAMNHHITQDYAKTHRPHIALKSTDDYAAGPSTHLPM